MELERGVLAALPDAILVIEQGRVVWTNRATERLLAASAKELRDRPLGELLAPGDEERIERLEKHRRDGWEVSQTLRVRMRRRDGGREVHVDLRVVREAGRLVLSAREASESRAAEELMAQLANVSAQAGAILDLDGLLDAASPSFEALGWMATFTRVEGGRACVERAVGVARDNPVADYTRSLVGRQVPLDTYPVIAAVVRERRPRFLDDIPTLQSGPGNTAVALSESMTRARGVHHSAWLPVPDDQGGVHVLTVAGSHLTEHDFVALQLFAAQLASAIRLSHLRTELVRRERLAAVGEMAAVLAHEVRNPLGVIFNSLGGLRHQIERPDSRMLLDILGEEAERLQRLVSELLDFARPPAPVSLAAAPAPLLAEVLEAARLDPSCEGKAFRVVTEMPSDLPLVWVDPELLRRALLNVVLNALQNVKPEGQVTISVARAGASLAIRVRNDGAPIPPAVAARIFEPFFTTRASGTGLGLAVVKKIVESLHGSIAIEPSADGACFVLTLPLAPPRFEPG